MNPIEYGRSLFEESWQGPHCGPVIRLLTGDSNLSIIGSMKTTVDIPEDVLKEAIKHTKSTTKRAAVVAGLQEFNRLKRLAKLADDLGKSDTFMTYEELMKMREADKLRSYK